MSTSTTTAAQSAIERFADAINAGDAAAARACLTADTIDETPDGTVYQGLDAVGAYWEKFIAASPHGSFELEGWLPAGDTIDVRWAYTFPGPDGVPTTLRGLDRLTARDGKISGK